MILTDRTQKRLRLLLSVAVVCAVLATLSEVRKGIGWAVSAVCGTSHRTAVVPVHRSGGSAPSMISRNGQPGESGLSA